MIAVIYFVNFAGGTTCFPDMAKAFRSFFVWVENRLQFETAMNGVRAGVGIDTYLTVSLLLVEASCNIAGTDNCDGQDGGHSASRNGADCWIRFLVFSKSFGRCLLRLIISLVVKKWLPK